MARTVRETYPDVVKKSSTVLAAILGLGIALAGCSSTEPKTGALTREVTAELSKALDTAEQARADEEQKKTEEEITARLKEQRVYTEPGTNVTVDQSVPWFRENPTQENAWYVLDGLQRGTLDVDAFAQTRCEALDNVTSIEGFTPDAALAFLTANIIDERGSKFPATVAIEFFASAAYACPAHLDLARSNYEDWVFAQQNGN